MNKTCSKCKRMLPIEKFGKNKRATGGFNSQCNECRSVDAARWRSTLGGSKRVRDYSHAYYAENREELQKKCLHYHVENRETILPKMRDRSIKKYKEDSEYKLKVNTYNSEWRRNNLARSNAMSREKQLRRRRATPKWLTLIQKAQIQEFYEISLARSVQTGIKHHVDHIFALKGRGWNGLHVPWNLQVLTGTENNRKTNKPPVEFSNQLWEAA